MDATGAMIYRLRSKDYDGSFTVSPALEGANRAFVSLLDTRGQVIWEQDYRRPSTRLRVNFQSSLPAGPYYLRLQTDAGRQASQLLLIPE
jgi:hypothetical protein